MHKEELQFIIKSFIRLNLCEDLIDVQEQQIAAYKGILAAKDSIITSERNANKALQVHFEQKQPVWWDNFYTGSAVTLIVVGGLLYLLGGFN